MADVHARLFRTIASEEQIKWFNDYYSHLQESGDTYGWPSKTFEILDSHLTPIMLSKTQICTLIKTTDHAHVVLGRIENILNSKLGRSNVTRDVYGDINQGELRFPYNKQNLKIIQTDAETLELTSDQIRDEQSESFLEEATGNLLEWYRESHEDLITTSQYISVRKDF